MATIEQYLNLIVDQHRNKPKFVETVSIFVEAMVSIQNTANGFLTDFDLDYAIGKQLDTLGIWIGQSRIVKIPILDYYFKWSGSVQEGWSNGIWRGIGDPIEKTVTLNDEDYRNLLYSKVLANNWQGGIDDAYEIALAAFPLPLPQVNIIDNQDLSVTIQIPSSYTETQKGLILNGYVVLTSEGILKNIEYI